MVYLSACAVSFLVAFASSATASLGANNGRHLSYELIAGYEPGSSVTDHNALDLDQELMEAELAAATNQAFNRAKAIYQEGAHSKSVATITLSSGLTQGVKADTPVTGVSLDGSDEVAGRIYEDYSSGVRTIKVQYKVIDVQAKYVSCQVGANPEPNTVGCFAANGTISIEGAGSHAYTYDPLSDNNNERTLQGFSLQAREKMHECANCPYVTYEKFYEYYEVFDYANQWVLAAFDGTETSFSRGGANFAGYDFAGKTEAIKKGTAYMSVWMYAIREFEDALDDCQEGCTIENCNDDPVNAWDEGVAFYTGSLEGKDGSGTGVFPYSLADKRCENFKTCGDLASETEGTAHVNIELLEQFTIGQSKLKQGQCSSARENKERIEQLMAVPLIQGALRYAYITEHEEFTEKAEAEGATFASAVLPLVHFCDEEAAATIYDNLKVGQNGSANFAAVKSAFESVYECMGVACQDVGGLYDGATGTYYEGAAPCGSSSSSSSSEKNVGLIVGLTIGGLVLVALVIVVVNRRRHGKEYEG